MNRLLTIALMGTACVALMGCAAGNSLQTLQAVGEHLNGCTREYSASTGIPPQAMLHVSCDARSNAPPTVQIDTAALQGVINVAVAKALASQITVAGPNAQVPSAADPIGDLTVPKAQ